MWAEIKAFIGLSEITEEENFVKELQETPPRVEKSSNLQNLTLDLIHNNRKKNNQQQGGKSVAFKVVNSFDEAQELANHIKNKYYLIVNLNNLDQNTANRLTAFLFGTAYALDAKIQKLDVRMFLFAPDGMDIFTDDNDEFNIFAQNSFSPVEIGKEDEEETYSSNQKLYFSS